jgi:hypothetical protein
VTRISDEEYNIFARSIQAIPQVNLLGHPDDPNLFKFLRGIRIGKMLVDITWNKEKTKTKFWSFKVTDALVEFFKSSPVIESVEFDTALVTSRELLHALEINQNLKSLRLKVLLQPSVDVLELLESSLEDFHLALSADNLGFIFSSI